MQCKLTAAVESLGTVGTYNSQWGPQEKCDAVLTYPVDGQPDGKLVAELTSTDIYKVDMGKTYTFIINTSSWLWTSPDGKIKKWYTKCRVVRIL